VSIDALTGLLPERLRMDISGAWHVSTARPVREDIACDVAVPDVNIDEEEDVALNCPGIGEVRPPSRYWL
jgi:hypothetical protein